MARLVALDEPGEAGDRLLEMGLTPGTSLRVVRTGLFGDPLQIEVRGYMLTLRRAQASHIVVEPT
jgi:Fe2+ transport system protein FeoA